MLNIKKASESEADLLSELAAESEAYWGYDFEYMEKFKTFYRVTEEFINNNPTFIMYDDSKAIGFYGFLIDENETSLEYFFIEPDSIGKGYGKKMWNHLIDNLEVLGIKKFSIVTSPQAEDFYLKMGAINTGEVESLLKKGRIIPRLVYNKPS